MCRAYGFLTRHVKSGTCLHDASAFPSTGLPVPGGWFLWVCRPVTSLGLLTNTMRPHASQAQCISAHLIQPLPYVSIAVFGAQICA